METKCVYLYQYKTAYFIAMGFSWFFPCSVWGGREPTAALADKTQGGNRRFSDLGLIR